MKVRSERGVGKDAAGGGWRVRRKGWTRRRSERERRESM